MGPLLLSGFQKQNSNYTHHELLHNYVLNAKENVLTASLTVLVRVCNFEDVSVFLYLMVV